MFNDVHNPHSPIPLTLSRAVFVIVNVLLLFTNRCMFQHQARRIHQTARGDIACSGDFSALYYDLLHEKEVFDLDDEARQDELESGHSVMKVCRRLLYCHTVRMRLGRERCICFFVRY